MALNQKDNHVQIETLMQDIREQLIKNDKLKGLTKHGVANLPVKGNALPDEFYENLYHLAVLLEENNVEPEAREVKLPLIGGLLTIIRRQIHSLVVFYVLKTNVKQTRFNATLFKSLVLLGNEFEQLHGQKLKGEEA